MLRPFVIRKALGIVLTTDEARAVMAALQPRNYYTAGMVIRAVEKTVTDPEKQAACERAIDFAVTMS
jgi:hypothetical protein